MLCKVKDVVNLINMKTEAKMRENIRILYIILKLQMLQQLSKTSMAQWGLHRLTKSSKNNYVLKTKLKKEIEEERSRTTMFWKL